jgi:hypothetical protein
MGADRTLPGELLAALTAELDEEDVIGLALGGSYARGDANACSDVDLGPFVADDRPLPQKRLMYRQGRLISISYKTCAGWRARMAKPETAIYAVPSARRLRILRDRTSALHSLVDEAHAFRWEPLQPAANAFASRALMLETEYVHKLLAALASHDELALCHAQPLLPQNLARALATQRGLYLVSDYSFYRQLIEAVGANTVWARALDRALGRAQPPHHETVGLTPLEARAVATLDLYRATADLLAPVLDDEHRPVVEATLRAVERVGAMLDVQP